MISFSRISKQYGRQIVFVDASFQLNAGERVGLVGPNGAGRTTLFRPDHCGPLPEHYSRLARLLVELAADGRC
jgi:ABC-type Mn2+/Zn2+ transport system ATPase subunit